jgi:hypothetical protein
MAKVIGTKADYSQNNPAWAGQMLGFSRSETIGRYGCLVTALANVAQAKGKGVDVSEMNAALKGKKLFSGPEKSDVARADVLSLLYPDIKFEGVFSWGAHIVAPAAFFDVRSSTKTEIIVQIDYHPERAGLQQHWCRVVGLNAARNDVEIVDSWDGKRKWLSSIGARGGKKPFQLIWKAWKYTS